MKMTELKIEDQRETIPLFITDEEFLILAKAAHEADITFNQFLNKILIERANKVINDNKYKLEHLG